jgi:carboxymethylenebutenolidase
MALENYLAEEIVLDCAEGLLTRREALRRLTLLGLTATGAVALLAACGSSGGGAAPTTTAAASTPTSSGTTTAPTTTAAAATSTSPTSAASAAVADEIRFAGPSGELIGAFAAPASPKGAVLVIHENRGLTTHIRTIPARLAADGYAGLAIDLLSAEGGTASMPSEGDATAALGRVPAERMIADLRAGLDELGRRAAGAKLGVMGFCFGGGMTWQLLAAGEPRLSAAVPFYGPAPDAADFSGSKAAAVLGVYAGNDTRVNGSRDAAEAALKAAGNTYELRTFDGVDHAFFNDTGARYNADAARLAYQAVLSWFATHLA